MFLVRQVLNNKKIKYFVCYSRTESETKPDCCLSGTVHYPKYENEQFAALKLLSLLKSKHVDKVIVSTFY